MTRFSQRTREGEPGTGRCRGRRNATQCPLCSQVRFLSERGFGNNRWTGSGDKGVGSKACWQRSNSKDHVPSRGARRCSPKTPLFAGRRCGAMRRDRIGRVPVQSFWSPRFRWNSMQRQMKRSIVGICLRPRTVATEMARLISGSISGRRNNSGNSAT